MFSGRRMWSYLLGAFVNALFCSYIPLTIMSNTQTIFGGGLVTATSDVGYPLELWSMGFCVWTNIIFSIIVMSAMMVPKWNWNFVACFCLALFLFVRLSRVHYA